MWRKPLNHASDSAGTVVISLLEEDEVASETVPTSSRSLETNPERSQTRMVKRARGQRVQGSNIAHASSIRLQAQTRLVSEHQQHLAAESSLSLYQGDHLATAGILLYGKHDWPLQEPPPTSRSEALAQGCLRQRFVSFSALRRLFDMLPTQVHARHVSTTLASSKVDNFWSLYTRWCCSSHATH